MKPIVRDKRFIKHYKKRIASNRKLVVQFEERFVLFIHGEAGYPINDHALTGTMMGLRAWSVAADMRVIYRETENRIIFLDVGTHAQIYE